MVEALTAVRARHVLVDGALRPATVRVADGRITEVAAYDDGRDAPDAVDLPDTARLLPGVVDTHVHVNEPGRTEWEGFATATTAAARGGVTTIIDMPLNSVPPTTSVDHLRLKQQVAAEKARVDVGFWGGAVPGNLADLRPLWEAGVFGFKCFLAPSGVDEFPPLAPEELEAAVDRVVASLATGAPQGLAETKKLLNAPLVEHLDAHGRDVAALSARLFGSEEAKEAMTAFLSRKR